MESNVTNESVIPEIEVNVKDLPSKGLLYPENATLKYRTYTFGEVRKASTSSLDISTALKRTTSGLIGSFDVGDLTLEDALYLGILRKISTFSGMEVEMPFVCAACKRQTKGVFKHTDLEFNDVSDQVTKFPLRVDIFDTKQNKKVNMHFSPVTVSEFLRLHSGRYKDVLIDGKLDELAVYASWVKNLEFKDAYRIISGMTSSDDMELIREIEILMRHNLKKISVKCSHKECGHTNKIQLEGREALLRPFRSGKSAVGDRIQFGIPPVIESDTNGQNGIQQDAPIK